MKTLTYLAILCLFILSNLVADAKELQINDFLSFRLSEKSIVDEKISESSFQFYDSIEIGRNKFHITYKNTDEVNLMLTYQWIDFIYCSKSHSRNRISFQIQNVDLLNRYMKEITDLGFVFVRKKIVDRQIYEVYSNGKHTIDVITSQNLYVYDGGKYYNFAIYDTEEYENVFMEENLKYTISGEKDLSAFSAGIE